MTNSYQFSHSDTVSTEDVSVAVQRIPYQMYVVLCHMFGLLSQDEKYGNVVFPLPQQRKSLAGTIFCSVLSGRLLICFGCEVKQTQHGRVIPADCLWALDGPVTQYGVSRTIAFNLHECHLSGAQSSVATVVSSLNLNLFYCAWKVCFMACGTSQ